MQITLNRQVSAVCHKVLATVGIEQERPDIQKILTQFTREGSSLPARAISFLEKENLISQNELTELGWEVIESGMLSATERGIFNIWYLDNDAYLGTRPLMLQRVEEPVRAGYRAKESFYNWPEAIREHSDSDLHCDTDLIYVMFGKGYKKHIENLRIEVRNGGIRPQRANLELELRISRPWESQSQVQFKLQGSLPFESGKERKLLNIEQQYSGKIIEETFMNDVADHYGLEWSPSKHRMMCSLPEDQRVLNTFQYRQLRVENIDTPYGAFEQGEIRKLPIMPVDKAEAREWQTNWLVNLLEEEHLNPAQVNYQQKVWLEHSAVQEFGLETLEDSELLNELNLQQNPNSFWHAAAPHFLLPGSNLQTLPSFTFAKGDELEASDLLRGLVLNKSVDTIIYSDRHYKSSTHAKNMRILAKVAAVDNGLIFTESTKVKIPQHWQQKQLVREKDNHDRYWILICDGKPLIWKCTTSFDFIDFSLSDPRVQGTPTFVRIRHDDLPEYLQKAVMNVNAMEVFS